MSEPILPTRPGTIASSMPAGEPRNEFTRTNINVGGPTDRGVASGSGLGTGMLVAGVLVVIGLLALFMFGDRNTVSQNPVPDVTIENTNVPAADPAPAPAVVPDPAPAPADPIPAPDTGTVDPVQPTPDPAAPANP